MYAKMLNVKTLTMSIIPVIGKFAHIAEKGVKLFHLKPNQIYQKLLKELKAKLLVFSKKSKRNSNKRPVVKAGLFLYTKSIMDEEKNKEETEDTFEDLEFVESTEDGEALPDKDTLKKLRE